MFDVILLTLMAGLAMPAGAMLATLGSVHPGWLEDEFRHGVIAFGGGALLSAVALVLVPEGIEHVSMSGALAAFLAGGVAFMLLDEWLAKSQTPASQLAAMLSDFVPESIALGAAFALGGSEGLLLAVLMALQNLPEGFNAYREMRDSGGIPGRKVIGAFFFMAFLGPIAGVTGFLWLSEHPLVIGMVMLFASGGILYSVFQDIAPQSRLEKRWVPALGSVLGFGSGLMGHLLVMS